MNDDGLVAADVICTCVENAGDSDAEECSEGACESSKDVTVLENLLSLD